MGWFTDICRNLGLMVHNIKHPDPRHAEEPQRKTIRKEVHEEKQGNVTLRRTTIEEVEIRPEDRNP